MLARKVAPLALAALTAGALGGKAAAQPQTETGKAAPAAERNVPSSRTPPPPRLTPARPAAANPAPATPAATPARPGAGPGASADAASKIRPVEDVLVNDSDPLKREAAAQVLGHRGDPHAMAILLARMEKDPDKWVRARCAEALGLLGARKAVGPLQAYLSRDKDQRVRRTIARALVRLGQRSGVEELLWQLKSGTNHTKAEVMEFLVGFTGQPLGQDVEGWWRYFSSRGGFAWLAARPQGSPGLREMHGIAPAPGARRQGPHLFVRKFPGWRAVPAVTITLYPRREAVTARVLAEHEQRFGAIADGCFVLIKTGWQEAAAARRGESSPPGAKAALAKQPPGRERAKETPGGAKAQDGPPSVSQQHSGPGLTLDAVEYLLARAPRLIGVGVDSPALDPPGLPERPARRLLLDRGRIVIESLDDIERVAASGARLLLFSPVQAGPGPHAVQVIAVLP